MSDAETPTAAPTFQRRLNAFDATMLVVGTMIGSGIFVTSVAIAQDVRTSGWLLAVWGLSGFMTVIGALSYAELAGMMPQAGGQYVYLREAYSPLWGFLYGWTCFLVIQTGSIAAVGVVFAKYLGVLVPQLGTDTILYTVRDVNLHLSLPWMAKPFFEMKDFTISAGQLVAVAVIAFLTLLNCRGVEEGKLVQNFFTVAKTLALVAAHRRRYLRGRQSPRSHGQCRRPLGRHPRQSALRGGEQDGGLLGSAGRADGGRRRHGRRLFSSDAWNNITFTAGEIRNPHRNLPLSLAVGTSTVVLLYLLANVAYLQALPVRGLPALDRQVRKLEAEGKEQEKKELLAKASPFDRGIAYAEEERVGSAVLELWNAQLGASLMAVAIMVSTFGCVNGMSLMGAHSTTPCPVMACSSAVSDGSTAAACRRSPWCFRGSGRRCWSSPAPTTNCSITSSSPCWSSMP